MSSILIALAFQVFTWRDGVVTKLYQTPCENPDLIEWLDSRFKEPVLRALNIEGTKGIEACYIKTDVILFVLDVKDQFRAHLILDEQTQ